MPHAAHPLIFVTGATGKVGSAVVAELCAREVPVRAVVRVADARSAALQRLGAQVMVVNLFDAVAMTEAMRGVARALYIAPFDPRVAQGAAAFAAAARNAVPHGLEGIVSLSQWLASPNHPSPLTRHHYHADQSFAALAAAAGLACTVVNPGFFADNYLRLIGFAAQLGVLPSLTGDSTNAPPSTEDIARVITAALIAPAAHAGRTYRPTGPALLSTRDMAGVLGLVLGHPVHRVELPLCLFLKAARMQGVGPYELSNLRPYIVDHRQGAFAVGGPTDAVRIVTGRAPDDFATAARRYIGRPEAQRTLGHRVRAWANFLCTPLVRGYDLNAYDRVIVREFGLTIPTSSRYAMEDLKWRAMHGAEVNPTNSGGAVDPGTAAQPTLAAAPRAGSVSAPTPRGSR